MKTPGFTLIELLIAIAIIGLLATIALPKMSRLISKAREAQTLGNLAILRSSLGVYYTDYGRYPGFPRPFSEPAGYGNILQTTLVPVYLSKIPKASPSHHSASNAVFQVWNLSGNQDDEPTSGYGWVYDANPFDQIKPLDAQGSWGLIRVLCQHQSLKGANWSTY